MILNLIIEALDAVLSLYIISLIVAKCTFGWSAFFITLLVLPFGIGVVRYLLQK